MNARAFDESQRGDVDPAAHSRQNWLRPGGPAAKLYRWVGLTAAAGFILYFAFSDSGSKPKIDDGRVKISPGSQTFVPASTRRQLSSTVVVPGALPPAPAQDNGAALSAATTTASPDSSKAPNAPLPRWLPEALKQPVLGAGAGTPPQEGDFQPIKPGLPEAGATRSSLPKNEAGAAGSMLAIKNPLSTQAASGAEDVGSRARSAMLIFDQSPRKSSSASGFESIFSGAMGANADVSDKKKADALEEKSKTFLEKIGSRSTNIVKASSPEDLSYKILEGKLISGVLETPITTDLPGYVRAMIDENVYGEHGRQILLPRMTRLIGEYESVIRNAQVRVLVVWRRAIRPDGSTIALGSYGTDTLGTAGLAGQVDNHYGQRFGAAVLISWIAPALSNASPWSGQETSTSIGSSLASPVAQGLSTVTGDVLKQQLNIPPTIKIEQGTGIKVFAAQDLDFSVLKKTN